MLPHGSSGHRIVIVGANFAGLRCAQQLSSRHGVTVLDTRRWFEWLPNIHELLSGVKRPRSLRLPMARLVTRAGHRFVRATVATIDARSRVVTTTAGKRLPFDVCVVAVGGVNDTFGVPGADRYAMPFKSVDDCAAIGERLRTLVRRQRRASVVVVGGGLEGIEALGEILRRFRDHRSLQIHLVEAASRLLPGTPAELDRLVRRLCAPFAVQIIAGTSVRKVGPRSVWLSGGKRLAADLIVWTGGATAAPLLHASQLAVGPKRWAPVRATLQSRAFDHVFVVGDAAALPHPLGKQAYYAMQMGEHAAANIERLVAGQRLKAFVPAAKPMLIAFGDLTTILVAGKTVVATPALAALKEAVFQLTMAKFDPPTSGVAIAALTQRIGNAVTSLAQPAVSDWQTLSRLARVELSR